MYIKSIVSFTTHLFDYTPVSTLSDAPHHDFWWMYHFLISIELYTVFCPGFQKGRVPSEKKIIIIIFF